MATPNAVIVKNISPNTSDKEVRDFFAFCGKITELKVELEGETKGATVTFEKETAAKTALLLNNTQLGTSQITVTGAAPSSSPLSGADDSHRTSNADRDTDEITQEEKPRSRILAEYLAHGYVIGDAALQTAIDLDHKHGVSARFLGTLQTLDKKYHATDRAKTADQSYGITNKANSLFSGLSSYFEKAAHTPTGKKVVDFYTKSQRQVQDVHNEARRLANLKTEEAGGSAYKAAGLEKVFGAEKKHQQQPTGGPGSGPTSTPASVPGTVPATGAAETTEKTKTTPVEPPPKA